MSRELMKKSSGELVGEAINDLNCHKYFDEYKTCISDN